MILSFTRYRNLLVAYLQPQWQCVLLLFILLLSGIGLSLISPLLIQTFIDAALSGSTMQKMVTLAVAFLGVAVLRQAAMISETYTAENISLTTTNTMRADLTLHCLHLDPIFYTLHTPGELIERIDGDTATLGNFFSRFLISLLGNILLLSGILVVLFRVDWRVGLALTGFVAAALMIIGCLRNRGIPYWKMFRQANADLFGFLEEHLSSTEDIHTNGATAYAVYRLAEFSRRLLYKRRTAVQASLAMVGAAVILSAIGTAVSLGLGIYLFELKQISIGTVYLIFSYTTLLTGPIEQIIEQMRDMQQSTGSLARISDLFEIRGTITDGIGAVLPKGSLAVEFMDVSFNYSANIPVLQHISFALQPGMVMGLLGRTGSGKSTLVKLLARLYDPNEGTVYLSGIDLRMLRLDELRKRIGVVTQDVQILQTTVRNNLTFFDSTITDERILRVLADLGLNAWYKALPEGLGTKLTLGGSGLSAGEAQLLSFARVFLKDPGLVILDEASSRLDPATERLIEQAIDKLLEGRTAIIIAHHLATLQRADTIMVLEHGLCCEYGPREVLANDSQTHFAQLVDTRTGP